jgi:hypothetical protein
MHVFPGVGRNDVLEGAGAEWARVIAAWARGLSTAPAPVSR